MKKESTKGEFSQVLTMWMWNLATNYMKVIKFTDLDEMPGSATHFLVTSTVYLHSSAFVF